MTIEHPMFPPREIETYEPYGISDAFSAGLARIERLGPCRRLVFYTAATGAAGATEHHVVAKLVLPAEVAEQVAAMLFAVQSDRSLDPTPRHRTATH